MVNIIKLVIEVLVAIVIIAVFVSIIFPALCGAGVTLLCGL